MVIGQRLRQLRELKQMSQGDVENKTGMLRCYISRVENGHTVPSLETLERFAAALDVPVYELFFDPENQLSLAHLTPHPSLKEVEDQSLSAPDRAFLRKLEGLVTGLRDHDRRLLLALADRMVESRP
jgi:transcriptional regulator with XRE-family HTH domain